jgi:hypothetical protein
MMVHKHVASWRGVLDFLMGGSKEASGNERYPDLGYVVSLIDLPTHGSTCERTIADSRDSFVERFPGLPKGCRALNERPSP